MTLIVFYFAGISLGSGLFFNQAEAWHGPIRSSGVSLKGLTSVEQWRRSDEQRESSRLPGPDPGFSALQALPVLASAVRVRSSFVLGLSLARLIDGHLRLRQAKKDVEKGVKG